MSPLYMISMAVALAMDAFAVSIASGAVMRRFQLRHALMMGAWFGVFQALMPLLGWLGGMAFRDTISRADHWIAFGLLSAIGAKMIYESFKIEEIERRTDPFTVPSLFVLSVATSIDALAVGLSLAVLGAEILLPAAVIGTITFCVSFCGVCIGARGAHFFEKKVEILGGLILIGIGVKILFSHIWGSDA